MSNNNNYFGIYSSATALTIGGIAAIGMLWYNTRQEQQNHNYHNYERDRITQQRREVEERYRREYERLQNRIREEERIRRQTEAEMQLQKEEEERQKRQELLQFKQNELANMDKELNKFLGIVDDTEVNQENEYFNDETMNPNQRIKEEHRRRRQQRKEQRDLQCDGDEEEQN